jgi:cysteine desulfurase
MAQIYFDNAATTRLSDGVKVAMVSAMDVFGNPSSVHSVGRKSKALIESTRTQISKYFNCQPGEIVFTSGGTEADNLAILGTIETEEISTIISSKLEHPAVVESILKAETLFHVNVKWVSILENGHIDLSDLKRLLTESPKALVSLMHVNNEIGNILDIQKVGELCQEHGAVFHSDMVQSVGRLPVDLSKLPVDLISCSAHKLHGPKGVGFLYHRKGTKLSPQSKGGKQEREYRGGTENLIGIAGFGKALEITFSEFDNMNARVLELKTYFISEITQNFKNLQFNGESGNTDSSVNTIVSLNIPNQMDNEMLLFQFDLKGIMVSGGSACSSGSLSGSKVLNEIGVEGASIRFSFSAENTKEEIDVVIRTLSEIID